MCTVCRRLRWKLALMNSGWPKPERTTSTVLLTGNKTAEIYTSTLLNMMLLHLDITETQEQNHTMVTKIYRMPQRQIYYLQNKVHCP